MKVSAVVLALLAAECAAFQAPKMPSALGGLRQSSSARAMSSDEFLVGVLGDLHIDPRKMEDYEIGRSQWLPIFDDAKAKHGNVAIVSLGDLGESKNCDHNPTNPSELFAGTTICHEMAAEFLGSMGVPYEVVGGNHGEFGAASVYALLLDDRIMLLGDRMELAFLFWFRDALLWLARICLNVTGLVRQRTLWKGYSPGSK
jgi:hypothetical protein